MPANERMATGTWRGDLRGGNGTIDAASGVLRNTPYTYATRFEQAPGTNPDELIAAAQAACYSMAFANYLSQQGHVPDEIETRATVTLEFGGGQPTKITKVHLATTGRVPGVDDATFKRLAQEAEQRCPVANLLRPGTELTLEAALR